MKPSDRDRSGRELVFLREDPRIETALEARLHCAEWAKAERLAMTNISRGGMFLATRKPVAADAQVKVTVVLPDGREVMLRGTVRHVRTPERSAATGEPPGIGVKIDSEGRNELMALVEIARIRQDKPPKPSKEAPAVHAPSPSSVRAPGSPGSATALASRPLVRQPRAEAPSHDVPAIAPAPGEQDRLSSPRPGDTIAEMPAIQLVPPGPVEAPPSRAQAAAGEADIEIEIDVEGAPSAATPPCPAAPRAGVAVPEAPVAVAPRKHTPGAPVAQPVPRPATEPSGPIAGTIGIDFGASYSAVALAIGGTVRTVKDAEGRSQVPSLIGFPDSPGSEPALGWAARELQAQRPDRVVASIKRILGLSYSDPHAAGFLHALPFSASAGPGDGILLQCGESAMAVPQLCAMVLRHLLDSASSRLGSLPRRAVMTHPVSFKPAQREALHRAAQIAGIEVAALVEEPVAAALAYGVAQDRNEIVAVYDFGGGTFDFTILDMSGRHYRVLACDGDAWLGGDDFDSTLAEALANSFWRKTKVELRHRAVEWQRLLLACEQVKCRLSTREAAEFELGGIQVSKGLADFQQRIERKAFERACHPLFVRSLEVCRQALASIGLDPRDITQVVLTGGTSLIPFIRHGLEHFFERKIPQLVRTDTAIVLGAGLYAARLERLPVCGIEEEDPACS